MARRFTASQSQYCERSGDPVAALPLTISCHFWVDNDTSLHNLVSIENTSGFFDWVSLHADGTSAGDPVVVSCFSGGNGSTASSSTGFRAGAWNHAGLIVQPVFGTFFGDRYAFCNGVVGTKGSGTQAYLRTPAAVKLGVHMNYGYSNVALYDVAIYAGALDFTDMARLANLVPARNIRRDILVFNAFAPGARSRNDLDSSRLRATVTPFNSPRYWSDPPLRNHRRRPKIFAGVDASGFTAAIAGTMGAMTASLAASHTVPTYTAAIAATHAAMTAAVSASHSPPTSTANIAATLGPMTATIAAAFTKPTYTATISGTVAPMIASVAAQFTKPTYTAAIAGTVAPMVATVSATAADPTNTAAITATNAAMSASVAATFGDPEYTATIAATNAPMSAAVSATFDQPTYTASIAATFGAMTSTVSATSATEIDTASIVATMGAMTASLTAAFSDVVYVTTECGIVPHFTRSTVPRFRRRNIVASIRRNTVPRFRRARR